MLQNGELHQPEQESVLQTRDFVFVRVPEHVDRTELSLFLSRLEQKGLHVVQVPQPERSGDGKWFPTDWFRQIGDLTIIKHVDRAAIGAAIRASFPNQESIHRFPLEGSLEVPLAGGNVVYLTPNKVCMYGIDDMDSTGLDPKNPQHSIYFETWIRPRQEQLQRFLAHLENDGWSVFPVRTSLDWKSLLPEGVDRKIPSQMADLDFLFCLFQGKDGKTHAIVADAFKDRVAEGILWHSIPNDEAVRGGCNVADLLDGTVLVPPHREDAPTTWQILSEFAQAELIEAPRQYLEGGGGPRCSISAVKVGMY